MTGTEFMLPGPVVHNLHRFPRTSLSCCTSRKGSSGLGVVTSHCHDRYLSPAETVVYWRYPKTTGSTLEAVLVRLHDPDSSRSQPSWYTLSQAGSVSTGSHVWYSVSRLNCSSSTSVVRAAVCAVCYKGNSRR